MWGRRREPRSLVVEALRVLRLAVFKARVGDRFVSNRVERQRFFREVTVTTAFMGFPVPPEVMSKLYMRDALGDVKKVLKLIEQLDKELRKRFPGLYEVAIRRSLVEAEEILAGIVRRSTMPCPEEFIELAARAEEALRSVEDAIRRYEAYRPR